MICMATYMVTYKVDGASSYSALLRLKYINPAPFVHGSIVFAMSLPIIFSVISPLHIVDCLFTRDVTLGKDAMTSPKPHQDNNNAVIVH